LVTGAAGFIGFHLATALASEGHDVTGIDSFTDYYAPELKRLRAKNLAYSSSVAVQDIDLSNKPELVSLVKKYRFDAVFHLAAQPGVRLKPNQYSRYNESNLTGFSNILEASLEGEIKSFLYASSSSVYGNSSSETYSETESRLKPISYYGTTKLVNEMLASKFALNSSIRVRGLRFFTVYGPWGRPDMAYLRLISSCLSGKDFQLYGSSETLRDFTYVDDVVRMVMNLNLELTQRELGYSDVVNIGGGQPETLSSMMKIIENEIERNLKIKNLDKNVNDVKKTFADSRYLESLIGTKPLTTISLGLPAVIKWAKSPGILENLESWINSVD
jgi:UDP-glucuronate 4-epimerase